MASRPYDEPAVGIARAAVRRGMRANAGIALRLAAERVELWLPGALAALAFLGWAPFVLAIAILPSVGELGFFGASLALSPGFPWNAVVLAAAAVLMLVVVSIVVAVGEASLQRQIDRAVGLPATPRTLDDDAARLWVVEIVAALPALAAAAVTLLAIANVAPGEYQSPDIGGGFFTRVALDVWPQLVALALLVILGQAYGASAQRAARATAGDRLGRALLAGGRDLARHPLRSLVMALFTDAALAAWLGVTWALLRVLWQPIGHAAGQGGLLASPAAMLLVGFVAVWLCLVLAGGALQAWSSAWWSLELEATAHRERGG